MVNTNDCPSPPAGPVTRPHWTAGSYPTAVACATEQNYRLQRFRRHNRELHEWGVACGLWVVPGADAEHPWSVNVCPGYAIGPYGDEIELRSSVPVDISDYLWFQPPPVAASVFIPYIAYVVVRYRDWLDGLALIPGGPCECKEPAYRESRTVDGHQLGVIWARPEPPESSGICKPASPPCPPCPESPWVTLAEIELPQSGVTITADMIDNGIRAIL